MRENAVNKDELFARTPVRRALFTLAIPTIISQLINLIYNMVDAFFIGRTGNSYMMAATTVTMTLYLMNISLANLFGIGGGSLVARMMGAGQADKARQVSAYSIYGAIAVAVTYSALIGLFLRPILLFLGASDATYDYARSYALIVVVGGTTPCVLSLTLAHLLRNTGSSAQASIGLSGGGILNVLLDPLFMFVLLPPGHEVTGAALATTLANVAASCYLLRAYRRAGKVSPLSLRFTDARAMDREKVKALLNVGVPSAMLTGLFDVAAICVNIIAAAHNDLVLAGMGIVLKVERVPNAVNVGLCQGMLPIVAYNYSSGDHGRMRSVISTARKTGLLVSAVSIALFELCAVPATRLFLSTSAAADAATALRTVTYAAAFLRVRCLAAPVQFLNYHASFCMQAMGNGRGTLLHASVRELGIYIPLMFLLDRLFGEMGLAAAMPVGEGLASLFALYLLHRTVQRAALKRKGI